MIRLLRLALMLSLGFALMLGAFRLIAAPPPPPELWAESGCRLPCWQGLQPGQYQPRRRRRSVERWRLAGGVRLPHQ